MAIIKQYHKDTDTTYVYESISYWDEEKKQSRSKRRVIGKLDPVTGEIVPTDGRGRKRGQKKKEAAVPVVLPKRIFLGAGWLLDRIGQETARKDAEISSLRKEIQDLKEAAARADRCLAQCRDILAGHMPRS